MKTSAACFSKAALIRCFQVLLRGGAWLVFAVAVSGIARAADYGKGFSTPEEAISALGTAAKSEDMNALHAIFGPAGADLENADRVQAGHELSTFSTAFEKSRRIVPESDSRCVLEVGDKFWPFPVPIVKRNGQWFFDTEAGKEELLNRRIGGNELQALESVRAYVAAQHEYSERDHDDDDVLEYAQKFISTPGTKDGLYWPLGPDGEISPLGPLVAEAEGQGYSPKARVRGEPQRPFHGYFFKIITRQGKSAPGGKYDYIINGNMIGGFALVAWPASYGETGIMTFIVNQRGHVYQKDLGPNTAKIAGKMNTYDPDPTWSASPD